VLSQLDLSACSVLFVDDDEYIVKALTRLMRPYGGRILTALSGEEALVVLSKQNVDVIVVDSLMPPVTGIQLIRLAKESHPAIVPIVLSGKTDVADIRQARRDGILHSYLPKPWNDDELVAVIQGAFALSRELKCC
jgi:CheY-like chemotaxis protein